MTQDNDNDRAVLFCLRVADGSCATPSEIRECDECGEPLWVSNDALNHITTAFEEADFLCLQHLPEHEDATATIPNWQREALNAKGISDEQIDGLLRRLNAPGI